MRTITFSFLIILCINIGVNAQDNNYWNQMPGSRSALMGGAVVAGVRDNSAVFYNPGALGFIDSNTISISATGYQYEMANIQNGGGAGVNLSSGIFQTVPLVSISGVFKPNKKSKSTFGFMLFTKNQTSNNFSHRFDGIKDTSMLAGDGYTSQNAGVEYIGDYSLQTSLSEIWAGLTYSYQINSHISIGVSPFFAYRTQSLNSSFVARVFPDSTSNFYTGYNSSSSYSIQDITYDDIENITFTNLRALAKFGIAFDYGDLKLGATFTTQSINLGGSAMIARDINYGGGMVIDSAFYNTSFDNNDRQQKLKTTYISPYSLSIGIQYKQGSTTLAFTGEYFGAIAPYDLATPSSYSFQRPVWFNNISNSYGYNQINSNEYLQIVEASQSVMNFAFAIEQQINNKLSIVGSFRTDYTSYEKAATDYYEYLMIDTTMKTGQRLSFSNIDLYHVTLGVILKNKKSDIHLGFSYTFGTNKSFQPLNNISAPADNGNFLGAVPNYTAPSFNNNTFAPSYNGSYIQNATYKYQSFSLLLGYTYHLK